jgi:hypothetical protein
MAEAVAGQALRVCALLKNGNSNITCWEDLVSKVAHFAIPGSAEQETFS